MVLLTPTKSETLWVIHGGALSRLLFHINHYSKTFTNFSMQQQTIPLQSQDLQYWPSNDKLQAPITWDRNKTSLAVTWKSCILQMAESWHQEIVSSLFPHASPSQKLKFQRTYIQFGHKPGYDKATVTTEKVTINADSVFVYARISA